MVILIVEDERKFAQILKKGLHTEGYTVDIAHDGKAGLQQALTGGYDVIVLDITMPKVDGLTVCKKLRERTIQTPVMLLTARGKISDRVMGLDLGADDYLVKPFGFEEFLARIRSLMRRGVATYPPILRVGDLTLDPAIHQVTRGQEMVHLTPKEYGILYLLMKDAGHVVSRRDIITKVWGPDTELSGNQVDVHIRYLRRKIETQTHTQRIKTVRGVGYKICVMEKDLVAYAQE